MYRISELIGHKSNIFHTNDLALLWGLKNRNTLYTAIKRFTQKGVLYPVFKGLYSTVPVSSLNPMDLGKAIAHRYAYLSTESVLISAGVNFQASRAFTFVSSISDRVTIEPWSFIFRKLKDEYLYNPAEVTQENNTWAATPERAAADILYFNPFFHFDAPRAINMDKVISLQKQIGYK
jgi:hypothetical protein